MKKLFLLLAAIAVLGSVTFAQADKKPAKLTVEEIVSKHLASIGTPEDITAAKSIVMMGKGMLTSKLNRGIAIGGEAQFASTGSMLLFALGLNAADYPYEKFAFDGKSQSLGVPSGRKTALAEWLRAKNFLLKEGLVGGSMSTAWALRNPANLKKMQAAGTEKIDDRLTYRVKYDSGGDNLRITLFFDAETFQHVRSEYKYEMQARMGATATASVSSQKDTYNMEETFSNFKTADKLTLPFGYKISIDITSPSSGAGTIQLDWTMQYANAYYNEVIDPAVFKVS
jgi:hypothetical protein